MSVEVVGIQARFDQDYWPLVQDLWATGAAVAPLPLDAPTAYLDRLLSAIRPTRWIDADGNTHLPNNGVAGLSGDAVVMCTSGTTGPPRAVTLTHDALEAAAASTAQATDTRQGDRWIACLSPHHIGGFSIFPRARHAGASVIVFDRFDHRAIGAANGTHISVVPTMLDRIDPASFRCVLVGGAPPPAHRRPPIVATYGMTETAAGVVYDGRALPGVSVRIAEGAAVGPIQVRTPTLFRAYRSDQPSGVPAPTVDGWFTTTDDGSIDDDGILSVLGRADDAIVSGGLKLRPEPVEAALGRLSFVHDVAAVGVSDRHWGQALVAVLVADRLPQRSEIEAAILAELPRHYIPKRVVLTERLDRTPGGKLRRRAIRTRLDQGG